jgi:hypothetical protein
MQYHSVVAPDLGQVAKTSLLVGIAGVLAAERYEYAQAMKCPKNHI